MKITKLVAKNFKKINGEKIYEFNQLNSLIAPNGTGKTTFLDALRYSLTGNKPDGDVINLASKEMEVSVSILSEVDGIEYTFTRQEFRKHPSKFLVNGKCTTQKGMHEKIEEVCNCKLDNISLALSEELVHLKPQDFAKIILEYSAKKVDLEDMMNHIPDCTENMKEILRAEMNPEVTIKNIEECETLIKSLRKDLKAEISVQKEMILARPAEAPTMTEEEVVEKLKELQSVKGKIEGAKVALENHKKFVENHKKWEETIKGMEKEVAEAKVERPDEVKKEEIVKTKTSLEEKIVKATETISALEKSNVQLQKTLDALESSVCPISPLITCHENKTVAKEEISDSIQANTECITGMNEDKITLLKELEENEKEFESFKNSVLQYNAYVTLKKQLKALKETEPEVPEKPDEVEIPEGLEKEESALLKMKGNIDSYKEKLQLEAKLEENVQLLASYEAIVKALSNKGPAKKYVLKCYTGLLEETCNECVEVVRPDVHFTFLPENGLTVLMDSGSGTELPYESLSGGEKALFLFVMLDLISQLSGAKILSLDEISVLDSENLGSVVEMMMENKERYDHIFISGVNYPEIKDVVEKEFVSVL